jgi:16S rRNA (guanine966-N2)-methyltransferase
VGLVGLSRGGWHATFVEKDARAASVIRRNAEKLGAEVQILGGSALALPPSEPFDLIFADPPYEPASGTSIIKSVAASAWLAPGGWMSVETSRDDQIEPGPFAIEAERNVGRARLTLLRRP